MRSKTDSNKDVGQLISSAFTLTLIGALLISLFSIPSLAQENPSNLVIGPEEETTITGPEFSLKGSIWVREGGSLHIEDTEFTIYQDYPHQAEILVESGGSMELSDSTLYSAKALDLRMEEGSSLILTNSRLEIPGKLEGSASRVEVEESETIFGSVNLYCEEFDVRESEIHAGHWTISTPQGVIKESLVYSDLIFHSNSHVELIGSESFSLEVKGGSEVDIYRKIKVTVEDRAGIPVGGADVSVIDWDTGEMVEEDETKREGVWTEHVQSEVITEKGSDYFGNFRIEVKYLENEISTTVSLPPVEKREETELEEGAKTVSIKFDTIVAPSGYYGLGRPDMILDDEERTISTYPTEGVDTYIHNGNIILRGNSSLTLDEDAIFKLLQSEENFRIELRDHAELVINEGALLYSDSALNIYLYESSSLLVEGGSLEGDLVYLADDTSLSIDGGGLDVRWLELTGQSLNVTDADLVSENFYADSTSVWIEGCTVDSENNMSLTAPDMEIISSSFDTPIELDAEGGDISMMDVETPMIEAAEGTTVIRGWSLDIDILNSEDRYVPVSDLYIYREGEGLVKSGFVPDGRTTVHLVSEEITHQRTRFLGNYILRSSKEVNGETVDSKETRIGLDSPSKAVVRYDRPFPYHMEADVQIPAPYYQPNETLILTGRAWYEGADLEVKNATVSLSFRGIEKTWEVRTDDRGNFEVELTAPDSYDEHTLMIEIIDDEMNMETRIEKTIRVGEEEEFGLREFLFDSTIGQGITIVFIMALLILAYVIATPGKREVSLERASDEELVRWAESVVQKR